MSEIGHNSITEVQDPLNSYVQKIERLAEEKQAITDDIKDMYIEVKSSGLDVKIVRKVIARRKLDKAARQEQDQLLDVYELAMAKAEELKG